MALQDDILSTQNTTSGAQSTTLLGIPMNVGDTLVIDIIVMGTDDTGNASVTGITALYTNIGGTISLIGSSKQKSITNTTSKNWNVSAAVDQPDNVVNIVATGAAGNNIRWTLDGVYATLPLGQ